MKIRHALAIGALFLGCLGSASFADTLAYWRFEEGSPGEFARVGSNVSTDSSGKNGLGVAARETRPFYSGDVPLPTVPQSGEANRVAADFNFSEDFFTPDDPLNAYNFSPTGSNAWTVEMSFKIASFDGVSRLFGRDGVTPNVDKRGPLQLVVVGNSSKFDVRAEILDGSNTFRSVVSPATLRAGKWYNLAATANQHSLKLYVDELDGHGYQLVAQKAIQGALNTTTGIFSIGRGFSDHPTDNLHGLLDEVRVSNEALTPSQFLFSTPTGQPVSALPAPPFAPQPALKLFPGADPDAAFYNGKCWLYITSQSEIGPKNPVFYAYSSSDLKNWTKTGPILQFKDVAWIYADGEPRHGGWAPSIADKGGKYFFYYAVGPQGRTPSRIGVAVGPSPAGPFRDKGEPLVTGGNGFEAIDPMTFVDPQSGRAYLYAGGSAGSKLRVWELAPDMMTLGREIPVETPPQFTEGVFMHYANGLYYLSYSHGGWHSASYSVHYATATSPVGPWQYRGPILQSDLTHKGPGHHSFVQDPRSGQWFIVYHRWQSPNGNNPFDAPGGRSLDIQPIYYDATGAILPITMNDQNIPVLLNPQFAQLPPRPVQLFARPLVNLQKAQGAMGLVSH